MFYSLPYIIRVGEVKEGEVRGIGTAHEENETQACFRFIWETEGHNLKHLDTSLQ